MLSETVKEVGKFHHRTIGRIDEALASHEGIKYHPESSEQEQVRINFCMMSYRLTLESVRSGKYNPPLSSEEREIWVDEAYRRSNFDWNDYGKFEKFLAWIDEQVEKTVSKT
jgi:hypothetical protein